MWRRGLVSLLLLGLLLALTPIFRLQAQVYQFRYYGQEDGLSNLSVFSVAQDRDGFIFVGTEAGLFRYDGKRFQLVLELHLVRRLLLAPDGNLWIGGAEGLARWDGAAIHRVEQGFSGPVDIHDLAWDPRNHRLLAATAKGLFAVDAAGASRVPGAPQVSIAAVQCIEGEIWFGAEQKVQRLFLGSVTGVDSLPKDDWAAILMDGAGNLWVRGQTALFVREKGSLRFRKFADGVEYVSRYGVLQLNEKGKVLVPAVRGLGIVDLGRGNIRFVGKKNGLLIDPVSWFLLDREGSPWIAIMGGGISRWIGYGEWESWTSSEGLAADTVWSITEDPAGNAWVATDAGISRLDRTAGSVRTWHTKGRTLALRADPHGMIWVATVDGLLRLDPVRNEMRFFGPADGLPGLRGYSLCITDEGQGSFTIWVGTRLGLYRGRLASGSWHFERTLLPAAPKEELISTIAQHPDGSLLVASSHGLLVLRQGQWRRFTQADGLASDEVFSVAGTPDGGIWVSYEPVSALTRCTIRQGRLTAQAVARDSSTLIYFVASDPRGAIWLGTTGGVEVLRDNRWVHYAHADGLVWNDASQNAFHAASDGAVWIGTSLGVSRFQPSAALPQRTGQRAVIQEVSLAARNLAASDRIVLAYTERSPTIEFTAPIFRNEQAVRFRYRLAGLETAWTETQQRSARYTNLPAGRYFFELETRVAQQDWDSPPAQLRIDVATPWWQTVYFYLGCAALAVLMARAFWRWRIAAMLAREHALETAVRERTDELHNLAMRDPLTGLLNRRAILEEVNRGLAEGARNGTPIAIAIADLDFFKSVNDRFGHQAGDAVLIETARRMSSAVRRTDPVGRYGGEELMIVLAGCGKEDALRITEQVRCAVCETPYELAEQTLRVTCSFGVAEFTAGQENLAQLIETADRALYGAKRDGRNRVEWGAVEALNR